MSDLRSLIERYVDCYNSQDIDGILACVSDDIRFENVSNSGQSIELKGKDALSQVAKASCQAFTYRRQQIVEMICEGKKGSAEIRFKGVAALNLPNGTLQGQTVDIRGVSIFESNGSLLTRISDYS